MLKNRIALLLLYSLILFSTISFAQNKLPSSSEIKKETQLSVKYLFEENFEKSLATARKSLHDATIIKDDYLIAVSYNVIASNFDGLSESEKALFYYEKALRYAYNSKNDTIINYINNNLGNVYCFQKKEFEKGIDYYKKLLEFSVKTADTSQIVFTKLNIAWAYFENKEFKKGLPHLEYVNKYHAKYGDEFIVSPLNMLNGMYQSYIGNDEKAVSFFKWAIHYGKKGDEKSDLANAHQEFSKYLYKTGDFKQAYENLVQYNTITEDIYNKEKLKKTYVAGVNLELDEYKREIDKIETEKDLQYQSLKKSKIIAVLFIVAFLVLLLFLYSLYKNYIFKEKANRDLIIANEELLIAKEKVEIASQSKTQFVSTISHELRTPLYGIIGLTNMLVDEHRELVRSPHLRSLKFSAHYLLSLVNDILQINKMEESGIVLENMTFNIFDEITKIIDSLSFISKTQNNTISINIDPNIPEYIIGDKLRFTQIIINLVSNASKFTNDGAISVSAKLVKEEVNKRYVEFKISDNGVGIAKEDQERIFEKFVQIGRKENDYQGTGLGLAIVKRLLELFDSEISLESQLGVGTTFTFTIAFEYDIIKSLDIINNIQVNLSSGQIFRILVVEDNKINQVVTKKIIEKNNCSCIIVDNGYDAIEILSKETFDVVLMDINMPIINGYDTTRKIRLAGITTPIIALTAFAKGEIKAEALAAGMNDVMIKPFESFSLFQAISDQINNETFLEQG